MTGQQLKVGFVALARNTFDMALAAQVTEAARRHLQGAGYSLVGPASLVTELEVARQVAGQLADEEIDLLITLQATFADSTMVKCLAETVVAPLLLWAVPEERSGGRLRLNSLCGLSLGAHALKRDETDYNYLYAAPDDPSAIERVRPLALAGRARRLLRTARVGLVGDPPAGLDSCLVNERGFTYSLDVKLVRVRLDKVFESVEGINSSDLQRVLGELSKRLDGLDQVDQGALRKSLGTHLVLSRMVKEQELAGLAVRCWPEFFTKLGCAACGALSMLSDEGVPCSCEADANGTVTQMILQWISGEPALGTDLVSFDLDEDVAVAWHCGMAPLSMADPQVRPRATIHSNRRLPLLMEFPLKPGRVTVARLSEATGDYRLVIGAGEMLRAPMSFSGTSGVLRFDRPAREVLDVMLGEGLEHHLSLTYGDHVPALLALSKMLDIPVLRL